MSDAAKDLAACLNYAAIVDRVLPVDHDADRRLAAALARYIEKQPTRKLRRKP